MTFFIESIIAGFVASLSTVLFIHIIRKKRDTLFYKKFLGAYDVFTIDGKKIEGEVVELTYKVSRLIIVQSKKNGVKLWESKIVMSFSNPFYGEGMYTYINRNDFGLHTILILPRENKVLVHIRNRSHPEGRYEGMLWRKA